MTKLLVFLFFFGMVKAVVAVDKADDPLSRSSTTISGLKPVFFKNDKFNPEQPGCEFCKNPAPNFIWNLKKTFNTGEMKNDQLNRRLEDGFKKLPSSIKTLEITGAFKNHTYDRFGLEKFHICLT